MISTSQRTRCWQADASQSGRPRSTSSTNPQMATEKRQSETRAEASGAAAFPLAPPIEPMLAKLTEALPTAEGFLFEPKWDGFRAIVFRAGGELFIQSRDLRPLDRYFP